MNRKVSKALRKRAYKLAKTGYSDIDEKKYNRTVLRDVGKGLLRRIKEVHITRIYKKDSPIHIYKKLKKIWQSIPRNQRNRKLIKTLNI